MNICEKRKKTAKVLVAFDEMMCVGMLLFSTLVDLPYRSHKFHSNNSAQKAMFCSMEKCCV